MTSENTDAPQAWMMPAIEAQHLHETTDGETWARVFVALHGGDQDLMRTWFANAIETGRSFGYSAPDVAVADPRTSTHTTSDDLSCADCGDLEEPMCNRCFGEFATAAIKRLTFERDQARAAVDAARADERKRIGTGLRAWAVTPGARPDDVARFHRVADMVERGEFDGLAASND